MPPRSWLRAVIGLMIGSKCADYTRYIYLGCEAMHPHLHELGAEGVLHRVLVEVGAAKGYLAVSQGPGRTFLGSLPTNASTIPPPRRATVIAIGSLRPSGARRVPSESFRVAASRPASGLWASATAAAASSLRISSQASATALQMVAVLLLPNAIMAGGSRLSPMHTLTLEMATPSR